MRKLLLNLTLILTVVLFNAPLVFLWICSGEEPLEIAAKIRAATCCDTHQCCAHRTHKNCFGVKKAPSAALTTLREAKPVLGFPQLVFAWLNSEAVAQPSVVLESRTHGFSPPSFSLVLRI